MTRHVSTHFPYSPLLVPSCLRAVVLSCCRAIVLSFFRSFLPLIDPRHGVALQMLFTTYVVRSLLKTNLLGFLSFIYSFIRSFAPSFFRAVVSSCCRSVVPSFPRAVVLFMKSQKARISYPPISAFSVRIHHEVIRSSWLSVEVLGVGVMYLLSWAGSSA